MASLNLRNSKRAIMDGFLANFGCPQTVKDRLEAFTAGAGCMLDYVASFEPKDEPVISQEDRANVVNLLDDPLGTKAIDTVNE